MIIHDFLKTPVNIQVTEGYEGERTLAISKLLKKLSEPEGDCMSR